MLIWFTNGSGPVVTPLKIHCNEGAKELIVMGVSTLESGTLWAQTIQGA